MAEKKDYKQKKTEKLKEKRTQKTEVQKQKIQKEEIKKQNYNVTREKARALKEKEIKETIKPTKEKKQIIKEQKKQIKKEKKDEKKQARIEARKIYTPKFHNYFEAIFSMLYLLFALVSIVLFFVFGEGNPMCIMFACMTMILLFGDCFHLLPRVKKHLRGENENTDFWLGLGSQISSITMTVFYLIMYVLWRGVFSSNVEEYKYIEPIIFVLLTFRFLVCFLPQNDWAKKEGNTAMSLVRNIPFCLAGLLIAYLFIRLYGLDNYGLWKVGIAVIVSFVCYMPVAIWGKKKPKLGILMIPKTLCYVGIILMFIKTMF